MLPNCITCDRAVQAQLLNAQFGTTLLLTLLPVALTWLSLFWLRRVWRQLPGQSVLGLLLLGAGLGAFVDGIVLHQMLQWHEMVSSRVPTTTYTGKTINMFWDGIFHAGAWAAVLWGVWLLWRFPLGQIAHRNRLFWGFLAIGWAVFNVVEGILDHHVFRLHVVRELSPQPEIWNLAFLGISLLIGATGYLLVRVALRPLQMNSQPATL